MSRISDLINRPLRWEQPSAWKQEYVLCSGDFVVARLNFESSWKSIAIASSSEGEWHFDRPGFWQRQAIVFMSSPEAPLAAFQFKTWGSGGTLSLPDGRALQAKINFWATQFSLNLEDQQPLINLSQIGGFMRSSCDVHISPIARDMSELPWLVPFSWYLIVLMKRDTAAASAAT